MELLILVAIWLFVCAGIFALTRLAAAGMRRGVGYYIVPIQPPNLIRLTATLSNCLEEMHAAKLESRSRQPLPPEVIVLRDFTHRVRGSVGRRGASCSG